MLCVETSREAKVCKFDVPATIEENVIWLNITVRDQQSEVMRLCRDNSTAKYDVIVNVFLPRLSK